jgi:predicted metal-dependent enzyme (double-stranded beta helix superfamily)
MPHVRLQTLIDRLEALPPGGITVPAVQAILADGTLDDRELQRFVGVLPHKYARRKVHRSRWFDVMALTWAPGQFTPIHNHAGNCGWVRLVRGQIAEETFKLVPGGSLPDAGIAGEVGDRGGNVGLEATGMGVISQIGAVATADRVRAIHRLGNPEGPGGDYTVTLHVYSLPHDRCLSFDAERRTCTVRDLAYDPEPV